MREDVIGRANVEDTPELDRYYRDLGRQESYALWTVANSIEPWQPQPTSLPQVWSYRSMRPLVLKALDLVSPEKAGRRVIALENPGRKGTSACVGWLYTGLQVMNPGEFATAHLHASSALRFIIEGKGAYTAVAGERTMMESGDFVITPSWTWHDHGNESSAPMVWLDGLDMHIVNCWTQAFGGTIQGLLIRSRDPKEAPTRRRVGTCSRSISLARHRPHRFSTIRTA
jgi:gentisate 1,2-dioxygenase